MDYYVTFDNEKVGIQQGTSLLTGLGILDADGKDTGEKGPFNIELFAGSPDDNNAQFFFNGAMSVLQPYLDKGVLKVPSGQTGVQSGRHPAVAAEDGTGSDGDHPQRASTPTRELDGVLSPYDGLSRGILNAARYGGDRRSDRHRPGRREAVGQVDLGRRAVLDDLQGHPQARQARGDDGRRPC